jgi:hypothetical protein
MVSLARSLKVLDPLRRYRFPRAIARVKTRPSKIYPKPLSAQSSQRHTMESDS